ncbi:uncharacterized protein LOC117398791 [Acipenser ruthenus]|uniref:uncharacterized protein LOC117398791 n=1 Tax=Acipenser ruthenus TaxID=7906 RepID=UPI0027405B02|nr:uncharacterized protein LOC117398791 [Acipenser ruthenus]
MYLKHTLVLGDSLTVKVSGSPLIVREGEDAVLPCLLLPTHTNAESLEVRWFRVEDSHVHTYIAHRDVMDGQSEPYKGRTSLFHEELRKGNVSLQLRAVRISDEGLYRCCVISGQQYCGEFELKLVAPTPPAQGSTPSVSLLEAPAGGGLSLLCVSEGWYPPPELLWTDETGADWRAHFTTNEEQDSTGLVTVRSQIHLPRQQGHAPRQRNTMICVVRSRNGATELKTVMNIADGSTPSVSLLEAPAGAGRSLLCVSEGWYPPPELLWTDETGADWRAHFTTNEEQDSTGLVTVRSQIHLPRQQGHAPRQRNTMICVVRSRDGATELKTVINIADGSTPSVSLLEAPAGAGRSLLCVSEGWYPPPELLWTDETGADWRAHFTTNEEQDSTGLVTVRSQIHLPRQQGHAPRQRNTMICVVRSRDGATELKTVINIAADGSTPSVSLLEAPAGGGLSLLCVSEGWYPPPELLWTDETGADWRAHFTTNEEQDSTGLVTVRSQIHLPRQHGHAPRQQNTMICVVRSRDGATELKTVMNITAQGSTPSVSLLEALAGGGLSLLCVSEGWYPPPELLWTDETGADWRAHFTTNEEQDSTGLVTVRSQIHLPWQQGHAPWQQNTMICVVRSRDGATELKTVMNIAEDCDISMQWPVIASSILAAVICIPVLLYFTRKPTKEKEDLKKQNETLKKEKRTAQEAPFTVDHHHKALNRDDEELQQDRKKEGLLEQNESLKKEKKNIEDEKEALQKLNDHLKREKDALGKEKEVLQKNYETLKQEKEKVEAEKEDLQKQNDHLKREKDALGKEKEDLQKQNDDLQGENKRLGKEKEDLQKNYDRLKRDKETLVKDYKGLQKQNDHLKREKDALGKEKEGLQKDYESLKKEKKNIEDEKEGLQKDYDHLKREKDALGKEKEDLQKNYESLKKEREKVEAEKEDLQKDYDRLKRDKEKLVKENKGLQKNYDHLKIENERLRREAFKKKNEIKTPTDNSKEGLEIKIKMLEEDFKDLRKNTNTCGYALGRAWEKMTEARVNMTLDPDTASPSLAVSEDGSQVRFTGERSAEWPSVLGREGFTSGMHYWEVEVGEKGYWVLGVSTHPHEKSIPEKPREGYWLVRLVRGKICTAVSQSGDQILKLEKICKVWGVYLDHEGGRLSFCNAWTRFHIHTLEGPFPGQVYPIFSPGSHDKGPLIIQRVQHTAT